MTGRYATKAASNRARALRRTIERLERAVADEATLYAQARTAVAERDAAGRLATTRARLDAARAELEDLRRR